MTNDTKDLLMQYLGRVAEHYGIEDHQNYSFKKRSELLEKLQASSKEAYAVMEELFNAFMREDRITNDKEKYDKARTLWESEHATAEKDKVRAEMNLVQFCKDNHIQIGKLTTA